MSAQPRPPGAVDDIGEVQRAFRRRLPRAPPFGIPGDTYPFYVAYDASLNRALALGVSFACTFGRTTWCTFGGTAGVCCPVRGSLRTPIRGPAPHARTSSIKGRPDALGGRAVGRAFPGFRAFTADVDRAA